MMSRVDSILCLERTEVQCARQGQGSARVAARLIVEGDSSALVTAQQLPIATGVYN